MLLGLALETTEDRDAPLLVIPRASSAEVPSRYASWAGRWVLTSGREVHLDASGLLGCFWGARGERTWASSSPALVARAVFDAEPPPTDRRPLHYEVGISWVPPPRSRFRGIKRLLPTQVLDLAAGRPRFRPLTPTIESSPSEEYVLERVANDLMTTLRRLSAELGPPWLGLTAGFDSRVILGAARAGGVEVRPFTRVSRRVARADRALPPRLTRECGYGHRFVHGRRPRSDRRALVLEHSAGHVSTGDVEPLLGGSRDRLEGVSIGGHGFSVGGGFPGLRRLPASLEDAQTGARQIARLFGEAFDSTATAGMGDWLEWVMEHQQNGLDWRDRFYVEQRMGGWLSAKEQVYDMARLERFPVLNCASTFALLLSLPEARRLRSAVQVELIRRLRPSLLAYPINPPDRRLGRIRSLAGKVWA